MKKCLAAILFLAATACAAANAAENLPAIRKAAEGVVTFCDTSRRFFYVLDPRDRTVRFTYEYGKVGPKEGDYLVVSGEPSQEANGLDNYIKADFRIVPVEGHIEVPVEAADIDDLTKPPGTGGMGTMRSGRKVRTQGEVKSVAEYKREIRIGLAKGDDEITVVFIKGDNPVLPDFIEPGAEVEATGIFECLYNYRISPGDAIIDSAYLYVKDINAFRLLKKPEWWTEARLRNAVAIVLVLLAVSFLLVLFLDRLVKRRTRELAAAELAAARADIEASAVMRERLRITCDLHDDLQQLLAGTMCRIKAGINHLAKGNEEKAKEQLAFARQSVGQTQTALRKILWEMHDSAESGDSMRRLFEYAARRFAQWQDKVEMRFCGEEPAAAKRYSGVLLMIMQEAVGNALKHGGAAHVEVETVFGDDKITMSVKDDGCGFDAAHFAGDPSRLGLVSMRLRAEQLNGTLRVVSAPGEGTKIVAEIPILKENQEK